MTRSIGERAMDLARSTIHAYLIKRYLFSALVPIKIDVREFVTTSKVITLMLVALMISAATTVVLSTGSVSAETSGDFMYRSINDNEVEITGYTGPGGDLVIPSTIADMDVVGIGINAFRGQTSIASVILPENVTILSDGAFSGCSGLTSISMGGRVTSIGGGAFQDCHSLASVTVPDSVTSIGSYAFAYCSSLTSITLSKNVKSIESWTFALCTALGSIILPDGIESIGWAAFNGCTALASVDFGEGLQSIGNYAFIGCTALRSVKFPDSLTSIGSGAFRGTGLTSVDISDHVTNIEIYAFAECASLTSINVEGTNSKYASVDGVLYSKDRTVLMQFPGGKRGGLTVPDIVVRIDGQALAYTAALTSVTIGKNVLMIESSAFWYSAALSAIHVDEDNPNYASIDGVLYNKGCDKLIQYPGGRGGPFVVPDSVTDIGEISFAGSKALTSITVPDSVNAFMGGYAFQDCTALVSADLGDGLTNIGTAAFSGCTALVSVSIGDGVGTIEANAFSSCSSLTTVTLPDSVYIIGSGAFGGCTSLTTVVMGENVWLLDQWAFSGCTALTTMIFDGNAPRVSDYWNQGCRGLTVFYREGATGFSTPKWNGANCQPLGATPTAPNGVTVTPGAGMVTLSWAAPTHTGVSEIDRYIVYQDGVEVMNVTGTSATITGLVNGRAYEFKVAAHNSEGTGQASVSFLIRTSKLTILSPVTAYIASDTIEVEWAYDGYLFDLDHFVIDVNGVRTEVPADRTSYLLEGLTDGQKVVKVAAVTMSGREIYSEVTFVVDTIAPTVVSRSPTGSEESTRSVVSVAFSEAMDESSVSVMVEGVEGTLSWDGNTVTFRPSSLFKGNTEYSISVSGRDMAGNELPGTTWNFTTANVGTISGTMTDKNGDPVPGSTVTLKGAMGGTLTAITNSDGEYSFYDVPIGEYTMTVEKRGYEAMTYTIGITSEDVDSGGATLNGTLAVRGLEGTLLIIGGSIALIAAILAATLLVRKRSVGRNN